MNVFKLALNSLTFYRSSHFLVWLGVLIGTAILTGALIIGDSVRYTLDRQGLDRIGQADYLISAGDRLFTQELSRGLAIELKSDVASIFQMPGTVTAESKRISNVQIIGVDEQFWKLRPKGTSRIPTFSTSNKNSVFLNEHLAKRLNVSSGDEIVLRVQKPDMLPGNLPLTNRENRYIAKRVKVEVILTDGEFGRYGVSPSQIAPNNLFLSIDLLNEWMDLENKSNLMLVDNDNLNSIKSAISKRWTLEDLQLEVRDIGNDSTWELRSERVFIDHAISDLVNEKFTHSEGILTYFFNSVSKDDATIPYSFISGVETITNSFPQLKTGNVIINDWLSRDLNAKIGDHLNLSFFAINDKGSLIEKYVEFEVALIQPIEGVFHDKDLMPYFPGLADSENCRDWDPGIPIDLSLIRDNDEAYWDDYRGTPKIYLSLQEAQTLWANAYGKYTALRFQQMQSPEESLENLLRRTLKLEEIGFSVHAIRNEALKASGEALDFGQLFLSLSFFIIAGAITLTGSVMRSAIERRRDEVAVYKSLGYSVGKIYYLVLCEYFLLILSASVIGSIFGILYNYGLLLGLETIWLGAVGETEIYTHIKPSSLIFGICISVIIFIFVSILSLRKYAKMDVNAVLNQQVSSFRFSRFWAAIFSVVSFLVAVALICIAEPSVGKSAAGLFFGIGFSLLLLFCSFFYWLITMPPKTSDTFILEQTDLIRRNLGRDPINTVSKLLLIAFGVFAIVGVGANRHKSVLDLETRSSGTGGFAFYAETTLPVKQSFAEASVRHEFGLSEFVNVQVTQLSKYGGGDASCFNLNRVYQPALIGIPPMRFAERKSFSFIDDKMNEESMTWEYLDQSLGEGIIPGMMDMNVMLWGIGKKVGDVLTYQDEHGNPLKIQLVGALNNSIFQGNLLISESNLKKFFPSSSGSNVLLVDCPSYQMEEAKSILSTNLGDYGIDILTTEQRMDAFSAVEDTYLSMFLILGALGVVIGMFGFSTLAARDIVVRRAELAILNACGYSIGQIQLLCRAQYMGLLLIGITAGTIAAFVAVVPSLMTKAGGIPWITIVLILLGILAVGYSSISIATRYAIKGNLSSVLRNE